MAFESDDFEALIRYLDAHPDLRDQLRRRILSEEFLRLPSMVGDVESGVERLIEGQARIDEALARHEQSIARIAAAQERSEAALARLTAAQEETDRRLTALEAQSAILEQAVGDLVERMERVERRLDRVEQRLDRVDGRLAEIQFRDNVDAYFGQFVRGPRRVWLRDLAKLTEAVDGNLISEDQYADVSRLDALVVGRDRSMPGGVETILAIEVSVTIGREDIERASRRAGILSQAGYRARPLVAGNLIGEAAQALATERDVLVQVINL
jgi:uncharacterized coiled-coil protein SlyX